MSEQLTENVSKTRATDLADFVGHKTSALQTQYLKGSAGAAASLARLRRAITTAPGADPQVWGETLETFPEHLRGRGDQVSDAERAAHAALTLHALHQQSQRHPMHQKGHTFGRSVQTLGDRTGSASAVLRRFQAIGTATSFEETLHHARGLITQLRGEGIPLDYGRFAVDLHRLQQPRRADQVRLTWGRDYYRVRSQDDPTSKPKPITP